MKILKYKRDNDIIIESLDDEINFKSCFEDGNLTIKYQIDLGYRERNKIDSYSIYQNGNLIEHQEKKDYLIWQEKKR